MIPIYHCLTDGSCPVLQCGKLYHGNLMCLPDQICPKQTLSPKRGQSMGVNLKDVCLTFVLVCCLLAFCLVSQLKGHELPAAPMAARLTAIPVKLRP